MKETIIKLQEIIEDGKRLRKRYPDCKILRMIEEVEAELQTYLDNELIK